MGQGSSYFNEEEEKQILEDTLLPKRYLQEIQKRYSDIESESKDEISNNIAVTSVLQMPDLKGNHIAVLLAEQLGGKDASLSPLDFVTLFSNLSTEQTPEEKMKILFNALDVRRFGYLGGIELYRFYHVMLSSSLSNKEIEKLTKDALRVFGDKIDLDNFQNLVPQWQIIEKMTVLLQITQ